MLRQEWRGWDPGNWLKLQHKSLLYSTLFKVLVTPTDSQRVLVGPQPLALRPLSPPPSLLLNLPATHRLLPPLHPPQLTMSAQVLFTKDHPDHDQIYPLLGFVTGKIKLLYQVRLARLGSRRRPWAQGPPPPGPANGLWLCSRACRGARPCVNSASG